MSTKWRIPVGLSVSILLLACGAFAQSEEIIQEEWMVVYMSGKPLGTGYNVTRSIDDGGQKLFETITTLSLKIVRFGDAIEIKVDSKVVEDSNGRILRFSSEIFSAGTEMHHKGEAEGDIMKIVSIVGGSERSQEVDISGCIGPYAAYELIKDRGLVPGVSYKYQTFNFDSMKASEVSVEVEGQEKTELLEGEEELWKITQVNSLTRIPTSTWMNERFKTFKQYLPIMGGMTMYMVSEERARAIMAEAEAPDVLAGSTILSSILIPHPYALDRAVYKLDSKAEHADPELFNLTGQRIIKREDLSVWLEVKALRGLPDESIELPIEDADVAQEYFQPSQYIESDDPDIVETARQIVGEEHDALAAAKKLERWVKANMAGTLGAAMFSTAKETLRELQGDCTEHSVLLAALLRAVGIPSRVAVGVVYLGGGFYGHMWTEAHIGRWIALDGTMANALADAARIKMNESSLHDISIAEAFNSVTRLLGNIELEVAELQHEGRVTDVAGIRHTGKLEGDLYIDPFFGFQVERPEGWEIELLQGEDKLGGHLLRMHKEDGVISIRVAPALPSFDMDTLILGLNIGSRVEETDRTRRAGLLSAAVLLKEDDKEYGRLCIIQDGDTLIILSAKGLARDDETFENLLSSFQTLHKEEAALIPAA